MGARRPGRLNEIDRDMRVKVKNSVLVAPGTDAATGERPPMEGRSGSRVRARRGAPLGCQVAGDGHGDGAPRLRRSSSRVGGCSCWRCRAPSTSGPTASSRNSPPPSLAAYNDWMADFVSDCRACLTGCSAPPCSPPTTWALRSTSWRATSSAASRRPSSRPDSSTTGRGTIPIYDPLWREAERLDVPVCFHGGGVTYLKPDFAFSEHLDKMHALAPLQPAARHHVRRDLLHLGRHPRAVP